jgi:DNA-binding NtrC family response regulator
MRMQHLRSVDQNQLTPQAHTDSLPADGKLLYSKLANISSLVSSLNAAVEDLETQEITPLGDEFDFYNEVERFEINLIRSALRVSGGSQVRAARLLKLNPTTLNAKMKALKLLGR